MAKLPCPRCGNTQTAGTFCLDCLRELHPLVKNVKEPKVILCCECERVFWKGKWSASFEKVLNTIGKTHLVAGDGAQIEKTTATTPEVERKPGIQRTVPLSITVRGKHEEANILYSEEYEIPLYYEGRICPACKRKGTTYFEGVLQIRNEHENSHALLADYLDKGAKKGIHVTKQVPTKNGTDYFMSSHRAIGHVARKLHKEFGGELKINAQHFSEDKQAGKILYRTTAYVELPTYQKGDVIKRDDHHYYILGMFSLVKAENIEKGKVETFPYVHDEAEVLERTEARVTNSNPLEVLHPKTFEAMTPVRSQYAPADLDPDDMVIVAIDGDKLFVLPTEL